MSATVTVTLHDARTIAVSLGYGRTDDDLEFVKLLGGEWHKESKSWLLALAWLDKVTKRFSGAQVAPEVRAAVPAYEEWRAHQMVRMYLARPGHELTLHVDLLGEATVTLTGPGVDAEAEKFVKRFAPALERIMRRQMGEKMALPIDSCVRPFEGAGQ